MRDAAYDALPKAERARLHERLADRLEATAGDRLIELEEVIGYHLERAHRYRTELGEPAAAFSSLAIRAAGCLGRSGERAFEGDDFPAAIRLLDRAIALSPDPAVRGRLRVVLALNLVNVDRIRDAVLVSRQAIEDAGSVGDEATVARARQSEVGSLIALGEATSTDFAATLASGEAIFRRLGDEPGLARVAIGRSNLQKAVGNEAAGIASAREAIAHASKAGDARTVSRAISAIADSYAIGAHEAGAAIAEVEGYLPQIRRYPASWASTAGALTLLHAMAGHRDRALALAAERRALLLERGDEGVSTWVSDGYLAMILEIRRSVSNGSASRSRPASPRAMWPMPTCSGCSASSCCSTRATSRAPRRRRRSPGPRRHARHHRRA